MIVTCYRCPKQICFCGKDEKRSHFALLFGWVLRGGRYLCAACGEVEP